jgi:hypothetical protein
VFSHASQDQRYEESGYYLDNCRKRSLRSERKTLFRPHLQTPFTRWLFAISLLLKSLGCTHILTVQGPRERAEDVGKHVGFAEMGWTNIPLDNAKPICL